MTLDFIAADELQYCQLFLRLDAFSDHAQSHCTTKPDHGINDRRRVGIIDHVADEAAVDLDKSLYLNGMYRRTANEFGQLTKLAD